MERAEVLRETAELAREALLRAMALAAERVTAVERVAEERLTVERLLVAVRPLTLLLRTVEVLGDIPEALADPPRADSSFRRARLTAR